MTAENYIVAYVDESPSDLKAYATFLESSGLKVVQFLAKPTITAEWIGKLEASLILVDYVLDQKQPGSAMIDYRGALLATAVRGKYPNKPIVILTQRSFIQDELVGAKDFAGVYDELVFKDDIADSKRRQGVVQKLIGLIEGFSQLEKTEPKEWAQLLQVLGSGELEEGDLISAEPPWLDEEPWRVPEAGRWVRKVILRFPGILYDSLHAATTLGIDEQAFLQGSVQEYFQDCRYGGVFASHDEPRWWKKRLLGKADQMMEDADIMGHPATNFSPAWEKQRGIRLAPSKCIFSGQEHADCVCWLYVAPVLRQYSLPYFPDARPAVMDTARLSFSAIEKENFDERRFREDARRLLPRIRKGSREG